MSYVEDGNYVYKEESIVSKSGATSTQKILIGNKIRIILSSDKNTILTDGVDFSTITANVVDYLGNIQASDSSEITFKFDELQQNVQAVNGIAEITFSSDEPGEYEIVATAPNCGSGKIKVVAE